jgi:hypothetical protein
MRKIKRKVRRNEELSSLMSSGLPAFSRFRSEYHMAEIGDFIEFLWSGRYKSEDPNDPAQIVSNWQSTYDVACDFTLWSGYEVSMVSHCHTRITRSADGMKVV